MPSTNTVSVKVGFDVVISFSSKSSITDFFVDLIEPSGWAIEGGYGTSGNENIVDNEISDFVDMNRRRANKSLVAQQLQDLLFSFILLIKGFCAKAYYFHTFIWFFKPATIIVTFAYKDITLFLSFVKGKQQILFCFFVYSFSGCTTHHN